MRYGVMMSRVSNDPWDRPATGRVEAEANNESEMTFPQVAREPRLSDKVADMMLETILSRKMRVGARLPSERELGEQFGVSRTVVREAVRALVAKGIIDARSGSGLRVAAVDAAAVGESMSLYLRGGEFDFDNERIRAAHEQMAAAGSDVQAAAGEDLEFHRRIALATRNELYLVLLDSIGRTLFEIRRGNLSAGAGERTLEEHARVLEAIAAHDPASARTAMGIHLDGVARVWRERESATPGGDEGGAS
jgi:GntR family transcriptional repressor for pyruvate dehydrogenase complex